MKKIVHIVPHSHWDREWYFSLDDSNAVLVENLKHLLDVLEKDKTYASYTFDAQLSVIEEYLLVHPEDRERIRALVSAKRLFIGPWYTQTDTLLVETESVIRNLLIGMKGAKALGHSLGNGYLPDVFGQHAYLPSIFSKFGINESVIQRGVYNEQLANGLNFYWKAPNGEQVKANNIYFGYGPGKFLAADEEYVTKSLLPILDKLAAFDPENPHILLPSGGDQVLVREYFPAVIEKLNQLELPYHFQISDYEQYFDALDPTIFEKKTITGELLACQKSRIHNTIRSQRVDIKLLNSRIEEKIYKQLEPLAVLSQSLGGGYPRYWINYTLKLLFDAQAHDSIGGCNADETNNDIIQRLKKAERIVDGQLNLLKKQIVQGIKTEDTDPVIVFNFLPKQCERWIDCVVFSTEPDVSLVGSEGEDFDQYIKNQKQISGGKRVKVTAKGEQEIALPGYYRTVVCARIPFEGFGYRTLEIKPAEPHRLNPHLEAHIQNEYYTIKVEGKQLVLVDQHGEIKSDFLKFEGTSDAGDSYDYSPLNEKYKYSTICEVVACHGSPFGQLLTVKHELEVYPDLLAAEKETLLQSITIQTTFELREKDQVIHVHHQLDNQAKDHRVRVLFSATSAEPVHYAHQGYSALTRSNGNPHLANWKEEGFAEMPMPVYPLQQFVYLNESDHTFGLYTNDLKEYEVTPDHLALTLFRAVGVLGKDDLAWRPGRASGINNKVVWTPDAQMQGELQFSYGIIWQMGGFEVNEAYDVLEQVEQSTLCYHMQSLNSFEERLDRFELPQPDKLRQLPLNTTLFTIEEPNIRLAACKNAEDSKQMLLRVYNPLDQDINLPENWHKQYSLAEEEIEPEVALTAKNFITVSISEE